MFCHLLLHFLDFVPIDLDEWWAQRFLANIDKLSWCSSGICRPDKEMRPEAALAHWGEEALVGGALGQNEIQLDGQCWDATVKPTGNDFHWDSTSLSLSVTDAGHWRTSWNWRFSHPTPPKKDVMLLWNAVNWYFQEARYLHVFIWQKTGLCIRPVGYAYRNQTSPWTPIQHF